MFKKGIDHSNLDETVSPKEDFYEYATGGWRKAHPLKPEYAAFGQFNEVNECARLQLRELFAGLEANPESKIAGTLAQKVSDMYRQGMDADTLNEQGANPIQPYLRRVENIRRDQLPEEFARFFLEGLDGKVIFTYGVGADPTNATLHLFHLGAMGLTLGDRDYYLIESADNKRIMEAYQIYAQTVFQLAGYDEAFATRAAKNVLALETRMAQYVKTREETRDPMLSLNKMSRDEIRTRWGFFDWDRFFATLGIDPQVINVTNVKYYDGLAKEYSSITDRELTDLWLFMIIQTGVGLLSDNFMEANLAFDKVLSGTQELKPRWKRSMGMATAMFSEAIGKLYVERYFPPENKMYMVELVENLRKALAKHISQTTWMTDITKQKALNKLSMMRVKIGYPDKWRDYSTLLVNPELSYYENVKNAVIWNRADHLSRLPKPIDKEEWIVSPQTVNAYYSPIFNEVCFPAGILQAPFFSPDADDAVNYGAIGAVIGHEMTHGFDDQGHHFDADGNLSAWWTPDDENAFKALGDKLVAQFDAVEVLPGLHANGRFTLGENIADQGGLRIALTAYKEVLKVYDGTTAVSLDSREGSDADGLSPLQRFFLSYAGIWAINMREEEQRDRVMSDPHSAGRDRTNTTLKNIADFHEAFDIQPDNAMYRPESERVIIW